MTDRSAQAPLFVDALALNQCCWGVSRPPLTRRRDRPGRPFWFVGRGCRSGFSPTGAVGAAQAARSA